uniref:RNase H type-1 domain-containing protein n=1 Tax=Nicotiana tabacum TaxID=4097 RepID=A0A1S4DDU1_TOBAC|nr:PREDICTED: uncharacterized protein LOC107828744 [Nicotiana tabacum]
MSASQKDAGASEKDAVNQISTEIISKQTDVDSRPDVIQEPEENENIKITIKELEVVPLFEQWPERKIHIGARLNPDRRDKLIEYLKANTNYFSWSHSDMTASGKFLGFLVSNRGLEVNPAQIKAIKEIPDILTSKKEVQRLTCRIAALGRFISRSSEKNIKFFSVLKKQNQFEWTEEYRQALRDLKAYLTNPPLLSKPRMKKDYLYILQLQKLAKWEIVSEYDIIYKPRTTIKSKVLADFVADFNTKIIPEVEKELQIFTGANPSTWTLFTDGSSNVKGSGLGIVLIPPSGESIREAVKCYHITNNEAEYEAVIAGLELARELSIEQIMIKSDSQLVVNWMQGTYTAREARIQQYLKKARELVRQFQSWKIVQIPREENAEADALANLASVTEVTSEENAIYGIVPEGNKESQVLRRKAARYCLMRDNLYRKIFGSPLASYTTKAATGETLFSLVYGSEALIPVEIGEPSMRFTLATEESNDEELRINLDLLKQRREAALIRIAAQKQIIERYYNRKAHLS